MSLFCHVYDQIKLLSSIKNMFVKNILTKYEKQSQTLIYHD